MDNRKIAICIPTYNDFKNTIDSISKIMNDERVSEIVIVDDFSDELIWWYFEDWLQFDVEGWKIKLCRNIAHLGESLNNQRAVIFSDTDYVLLVNSHKMIEPEFIDIIYQYTWDENIDLQLLCGKFVNRNKYLDEFKIDGK